MDPSSSPFLFLFYSCFLLTSAGYIVVQASPLHHHHHHHHHRREEHEAYDHGFSRRPTKLFVFGDSYADTGNIRKSLGNSWKEPYGSTFPESRRPILRRPHPH
ncbi:UNVERIFIED_CONTAM: GDSL esterase/lipase [Sesamum latifolium]|uniref:GDSL esterase/lipase n=1 Tax=Sesamum latifolium TaxID=2727402 RepID=A0AAW2U351_9LAMI